MEITNIKESRNLIEDIVNNSIADEIGIEPGDILVSINGTQVKDVIDYKYLIADEYVLLVIEKRDGELWEIEVEKDYSEDIGIIFTNPLIDRAKTCQNKCMFCFIDQLPPNMRDSLYFKDDDSRLSFLQGNFITLTNMKEDDIQRIIEYKLSPVNISVHTTNPDLRIEMLRNKRAGNIYETLKRFHDAGIEMNCQIVLVPGVNDGDELSNTINDLYSLYPSVNSVAVVPVGITKYRHGLDELDIFNEETANILIDQVEEMQKKYLADKETRFVFASDEFFCVAKRTLPKFDDYEGFPQYENGVGLMKSFSQEFHEALTEKEDFTVETNKSILIATGKLANNFLTELLQELSKKISGVQLEVRTIKNFFFGETITVSGLVTGGDLVDQIPDYLNYDSIYIPQSMMKRDEDIFLDNMTYIEANHKLEGRLKLSPVDGTKFIDLIFREVMGR